MTPPCQQTLALSATSGLFLNSFEYSDSTRYLPGQPIPTSHHPAYEEIPPNVQPKPPLVNLRLQRTTMGSYDYIFHVKMMHQGSEVLLKVLWSQAAKASPWDNSALDQTEDEAA
ncbi:hypothetical protein DUI87_16139 [Hirundo rustica rustica]|uniref:Uncharacterized protein n=1 Tax=Hirundo rustica rustica TaxID=333673 RepID=A0A3M0K138_HIRRU|nr:hypothetical protein DUI87_16139 [Hirundo rustica rustica]